MWCDFVYLLTVITSKNLQKHGNIWVCPVSDHVCTRFLFVWVRQKAESKSKQWKTVPTFFFFRKSELWTLFELPKKAAFFFHSYENGQVGDIDINTQEDKIQQEISRVIASKPCWENQDTYTHMSFSVLYNKNKNCENEYWLSVAFSGLRH